MIEDITTKACHEPVRRPLTAKEIGEIRKITSKPVGEKALADFIVNVFKKVYMMLLGEDVFDREGTITPRTVQIPKAQTEEILKCICEAVPPFARAGVMMEWCNIGPGSYVD